MPITALPPAPSRSDPSNFADEADAFLGALPTFATEATALESNVNSKEALATTAANNANTAKLAAQSAQSAAESASNATKWISGTTYTEGVAVWSPTDFLSYRRKITGAGTTDPSADSTNWQRLGSGSGLVYLATYDAATTSAVDIENISSTYDNYMIVFENVVLSSTTTVSIRLKKSGAYITGSTYNRGFFYDNGTIATRGYGSGNTNMSMLGVSTSDIFSGTLYLSRANSTSNQKIDCTYSTAGASTGNAGISYGYETTSAVVQGIRFYVSSGTFTSGTFKIYGIVKS